MSTDFKIHEYYLHDTIGSTTEHSDHFLTKREWWAVPLVHARPTMPSIPVEMMMLRAKYDTYLREDQAVSIALLSTPGLTHVCCI